MGPPQITNEIESDPLKEILELSPSLFSSPGKLLPEQILEDSSEYLTRGEHPGLDLRFGSPRRKTPKCVALCWAALDTRG